MLKISEQSYQEKLFLFDLSNLIIPDEVNDILDDNEQIQDHEENFDIVIVFLLENVKGFELPDSQYGWSIENNCDVTIF